MVQITSTFCKGTSNFKIFEVFAAILKLMVQITSIFCKGTSNFEI